MSSLTSVLRNQAKKIGFAYDENLLKIEVGGAKSSLGLFIVLENPREKKKKKTHTR